MLSEELLIPDYARIQTPEFPLWTGYPLEYRFDARDGIFKRSGQPYDRSLLINPFSVGWTVEARWGFERQPWLDLFFIDLDGNVSALSLKKDSALNLHTYLIRLQHRQIDLRAMLVTLRPQENYSKENDVYFAASVASETFVSEDRFRRVCEFAKQWPVLWEEVASGDNT